MHRKRFFQVFFLALNSIEFIFGLTLALFHIEAFKLYRYEAIMSIVFITITIFLKIIILIAYFKKSPEKHFLPALKNIAICYFVFMVCFPIVLMNFHISCDYYEELDSENVILLRN